MVYNRIPVTFDQLPRITAPYINYQYDVVQILVINGLDLPDYYTVDFCNVGDAETITITGTPDGVRIPNDLLLTGLDIKAYIILTGIDEGAVETRYEVTIPVRNRPMRQGVTPTPEGRLEIETLVNALNDGVERAEDAATEAESQADRAETAAENAESAVEHYPKIEDGYWYVWLNGGWVNTGVKAEGVDGKGIASVTGQKTSTSGLVDTYTLTVTYTDSTTDTLTFTVTNGRDGVDGYSPTATVTKSGNTATITITDKNGTTTATVTDGTDGVSPGVTITDITGGHRVTITDKDHPTGQSFDVMDGEVSQADLDAALATKAPVIIDTASGAIASFSDGADAMPVKSLVCQINPQQDLHGQSNPYPAGGGKQKFQSYAETATVNGVTFTANADGTVTANGTASADIIYTLSKRDEDSPSHEYCRLSDLGFEADLAYILNGDNSGVYNSTHWVQILVYGSGIEPYSASADSSPFSFSESDISSKWYRLVIRVKSGTQLSNFVFNPMIRLASVTDATFAPYENVCPISGWTGLSLTRDGKNVIGFPYHSNSKTVNGITFTVNNDGSIAVSGTATSTTDFYIWDNASGQGAKLTYRPVGTYTLSCSGLVAGIQLIISGNNRNGFPYTSLTPNSTSGTGQITDGSKPFGFLLLRVASGSTVNTVIYPQFEVGSTASPYEEPKDETVSVSWQTAAGTVYGGTDEIVSGELISKYGMSVVDPNYISNNGKDITYGIYNAFYYFTGRALTRNVISNIFHLGQPYDFGMTPRTTNTGIEFRIPFDALGVQPEDDENTVMLPAARTWFTNNQTQVCYELATPVTYQLDPVTVSTLLGENNIFADCGDVSVDYPCDTKLYLEKLTQPTEDDMIANSAIASGKYFFVGNRLFLSTAAIANGAILTPGTNCVETNLAEALNALNT